MLLSQSAAQHAGCAYCLRHPIQPAGGPGCLAGSRLHHGGRSHIGHCQHTGVAQWSSWFAGVAKHGVGHAVRCGSLVIALVSGKTLNIVWTLPYLGSLLYLAVFGLHPAGAHRRGSYGLYRRDGASDRAHRVGVVRRLPMAACHLAGRWFVAGRQCHRHVAANQPA